MPAQKTSPNGMRSVKVPKRPGSQKRVADLLASGAKLFAVKGFESTTMTEIAANAGASVGSLYQYFPTKELLAATLYASQINSIHARLGQLKLDCKGTPADLFCDRLFACLIDTLAANASFPVLNELRTLDADMQAQARQRLRAAVEKVLAVIEPPVSAERRPALAAVIVHLMRTTTAVSCDDNVHIRESAINELRAMLSAYMNSP